MKSLWLTLLVALSVNCVSAAPEVPRRECRCGLGSPSFVLCTVAADFYVARKEWPSSVASLKKHAEEMAVPEKEDGESIARFWSQFTTLEVVARSEKLVIRYRTQSKEELERVAMVLSPGDSVDTIVQSAADERPIFERSDLP